MSVDANLNNLRRMRHTSTETANQEVNHSALNVVGDSLDQLPAVALGRLLLHRYFSLVLCMQYTPSPPSTWHWDI
jgi:hypothetical protein